MKWQAFISIALIVSNGIQAYSQKILTEGTLTYTIAVEPTQGSTQATGLLKGATYTVYLSGNKSRTEMTSGLGKEATLHDAATGSGVILKEYSGQNLMITLSPLQWEDNNRKFKDITFQNTGETAKIEGFHCIKVNGKMADGSSFTVYYTPQVNLGNPDYDPRFQTLPGLPVQYEMQKGNAVYRFTLSKIDYAPVPAKIFEIPKSGYRVMPYQDLKK